MEGFDGRTRVLAIVLAVIVLATILELVRRRYIREKYAFVWLTTGIFVTLLALFPRVLSWLSHLFGFELPANFLFFFAGLALLMLVAQVTLELGKVEEQVRRLAEEMALLRHQIGMMPRVEDETGK